MKGFTRFEFLLILVFFLIAVSGVVIIVDPFLQIEKMHDSQRKSDLTAMQVALEKYYKNNGSYPLSTGNNTKTPYRIRGFRTDHMVIDWGQEWQPYMGVLPKDPSGKQYAYYASSGGQAYWLYATLERDTVGLCNKGNACASLQSNGVSENSCGGICNYGVSSPNVSP